MTNSSSVSGRMRGVSELRLFVILISAAASGLGQLTTKSIAELVASLTSSQPQNDAIGTSVFSCGETQGLLRERAVARELGRRGKAAVPELDRVLDSIEDEDDGSPFFQKSGWFLFAYARIQGSAAVPRLRTMIRNPRLDPLRVTLDRAIALSLGLTSYLSTGRESTQLFTCRRQEPKDALDDFVLALERGDQSGLESDLGSDARTVLNRLLDGKPWTVVYQEIWHTSPGGQRAVGYLFDIPGRWSQPEETLEDNRDYANAPLTSAEVVLATQFTTSTGKDCAKHMVRFRRVSQFGRARYLVDSPDMKELIASISSCFAQ